MLELRRRVYKRPSSFEITIPKALLFGVTQKFIIFYLAHNKFYIKFNHKKSKALNEISRSIYIRGSSRATTLPIEMMLTASNPKFVKFKYDPKVKAWQVEVQNG